jgi:hypothetical protein
MKQIYIVILALFILYAPWIRSQVVYEPLNNSVYNFLERQSVKGLIQVHDEVKPFSRMSIAKKLIELNMQKYSLTDIELRDLQFYENDFADEISLLQKNTNVDSTRLEYFTFGQNNRFRAFNFKDSLFAVYADPILGYSAERFHSSKMTHTWNGASVYGYIFPFLGYSFNFMDNQENGSYIDETRNFTPLTGIDHIELYDVNNSSSYQYDEINAVITASWSWGSFSFGKDYINWGSSLSPASQLIISSKAPSFPFIQLNVNPVSWLRFTYIHGFLNSGIVDSSSIQISVATNRENSLQVPKFISSHFLSVDFTKDFTASIGESVEYSEKEQPIYLIPVMFFLLAEHYKTMQGSTGDNSQLFADESVKIPVIRSKFFSTLFIDELSLTAVLTGKTGPYAVGYTLGAETIDPVIPNSSFLIEFTKISPMVTLNSNLAQTYSNSGYQLGNWIGNNGDILYSKYTQNFLRGLSADLWGDLIRLGSEPAPEQQYKLPYPPTLFGLRKSQLEFGFEASYEIINECWFKLFFNYSNISDQDLSRTPEYLLGVNKSLGFSISYGYNTLSR